MLAAIKKYYVLTKPGIIRGNLFAAVGGFFLASQLNINMVLLGSVLLGTGLIIGAACVFNNLLDRSIDSKMRRTQSRSLVTGDISFRAAMIFGTFLALLGFGILSAFTNILATIVGLIGFIFYVLVYGWGKRATHHGTLIGTISGATPPVAGYVAVTGSLDIAAVLLFAIMVAWQMPHFYAIAIFRQNDYKVAGLPILPIRKGMNRTIVEIRLYIIAFMLLLPLLSLFGYTGYTFSVVMLVISLWWLYVAYQPIGESGDSRWAKKIFGISLISLLALSILLILSGFLP